MKDIYNRLYIFIQSSFNKEKKTELYNYIWKNYKKRISFYISNIIPANHPYFEDLLQEIMMKIYNNLHTFNPIHSFKAWIYKITRNHCIDYIKDKKKELYASGEIEFDKIYENNDPEKIMIQDDLVKKIDEYINSLSATDREISYLRFYENIRYKDISKIMDINVNTVKSRIRTIKIKLKEKLKF
jgi:RNA polymerase sigma-70 factor (ECF subfamily)